MMEISSITQYAESRVTQIWEKWDETEIVDILTKNII